MCERIGSALSESRWPLRNPGRGLSTPSRASFPHTDIDHPDERRGHWKVLPDNCAAFVRQIVAAGSGDLTVMLNCPDQEFVKKVGREIGKALERVGEFQRMNRGSKW